jgi:hypothetical protein
VGAEGTPQETPKTCLTAKVFNPWLEARRADAVFQPTTESLVKATAMHVYRCFVLPTNSAKNSRRYISAFEIKIKLFILLAFYLNLSSGNARDCAHVIAYLDARARRASSTNVMRAGLSRRWVRRFHPAGVLGGGRQVIMPRFIPYHSESGHCCPKVPLLCATCTITQRQARNRLTKLVCTLQNSH